MKKSIFAFILLVSLVLSNDVSFGKTTEPKMEYSLSGSPPKLIVVYSLPKTMSAEVLKVKGYDLATVEPEIAFIIVTGAKETLNYVANVTVNHVMFRLPNTYG